MLIPHMLRRASLAVQSLSSDRRGFRHALYVDSLRVDTYDAPLRGSSLTEREWSRTDWLDALHRHPSRLTHLIDTVGPEGRARRWLGRRIADQVRYRGVLEMSYRPIDVKHLSAALVKLDNEDGRLEREVGELFGHVTALRDRQIDGRDRKSDRIAATALATTLASSRRVQGEHVRTLFMASSEKAETVCVLLQNERVGAEALRAAVITRWPGYIAPEEAHQIAGTAANAGRQDLIYELGMATDRHMQDAAWRHATPAMFRTLLTQQADTLSDDEVARALNWQLQTTHGIDLPTGLVARGLGALIRRSSRPEYILEKFAQSKAELARLLLTDPHRTVRLVGIQALGQSQAPETPAPAPAPAPQRTARGRSR